MSSVPLIRAQPVPPLNPPFGGANPLPSLLHLLRWPLRVLRARRDFARLAALSDHELRDIGLTRHDIRGATALPLDADPTVHLARVAKERHRAERHRAERARLVTRGPGR